MLHELSHGAIPASRLGGAHGRGAASVAGSRCWHCCGGFDGEFELFGVGLVGLM